MASKSTDKRAGKSSDVKQLKRFYFPEIGNGVTIFAKDQAEANEKAEARMKKTDESTDSPKK